MFSQDSECFYQISLSDKNDACLVQFLTFRSWQCLFKLTKEHRPCSIHCARSLWSFSAVPLQPSKLLGESKVHIPAAGGNPLMRCLWLHCSSDEKGLICSNVCYWTWPWRLMNGALASLLLTQWSALGSLCSSRTLKSPNRNQIILTLRGKIQ